MFLKRLLNYLVTLHHLTDSFVVFFVFDLLIENRQLGEYDGLDVLKALEERLLCFVLSDQYVVHFLLKTAEIPLEVLIFVC